MLSHARASVQSEYQSARLNLASHLIHAQKSCRHNAHQQCTTSASGCNDFRMVLPEGEGVVSRVISKAHCSGIQPDGQAHLRRGQTASACIRRLLADRHIAPSDISNSKALNKQVPHTVLNQATSAMVCSCKSHIDIAMLGQPPQDGLD